MLPNHDQRIEKKKIRKPKIGRIAIPISCAARDSRAQGFRVLES